jgi:hypothetical protein
MKFHADGQRGYLAHLVGRTLLLKLFKDTTPEEQAPGEGECELYANDDGSYVEIEVQGAFEEVNPGSRSTFSVRTVACELPLSLEREDKAGLRAFADERAGSLS